MLYFTEKCHIFQDTELLKACCKALPTDVLSRSPATFWCIISGKMCFHSVTLPYLTYHYKNRIKKTLTLKYFQGVFFLMWLFVTMMLTDKRNKFIIQMTRCKYTRLKYRIFDLWILVVSMISEPVFWNYNFFRNDAGNMCFSCVHIKTCIYFLDSWRNTIDNKYTKPFYGI